MFPVEHDKLATLFKPSEIIGEITKKTEKETGIPAGLPLIAAAADKASELASQMAIFGPRADRR